MMAMCLERTKNLDQVREWILGLREPYDRNNAGETEADNLGEALYLISLVSERKHPLVETILKELPKFEVKDEHGFYIKGRSDFAERPVYQTKWLKFGLRALGLPDPYTISNVPDSYAALFWMDDRDQPVIGTQAEDREKYPYLGWAIDHFKGTKLSPISDQDYPLTWETEASQAAYGGTQSLTRSSLKSEPALRTHGMLQRSSCTCWIQNESGRRPCPAAASALDVRRVRPGELGPGPMAGSRRAVSTRRCYDILRHLAGASL
jgi:hypothetical protein